MDCSRRLEGAIALSELSVVFFVSCVCCCFVSDACAWQLSVNVLHLSLSALCYLCALPLSRGSVCSSHRLRCQLLGSHVALTTTTFITSISTRLRAYGSILATSTTRKCTRRKRPRKRAVVALEVRPSRAPRRTDRPVHRPHQLHR